ncbi:nucleotide exchange factor GrpE [Pseudodesulfovibrio portus]|uniref:Nucleotide exchange factor GrpE n=1 Tax=Pseudodesulfovibrio portus TaxID=231439 RepID=A0ABN6RR53_9BACT|nr:nucleotide exchange factor GrpE [Pseudodesulfovibrio portus]BDQ33402.1 hypothetical protein JCM14722_09440 [Pseudodesulfovibrio portus]
MSCGRLKRDNLWKIGMLTLLLVINMLVVGCSNEKDPAEQSPGKVSTSPVFSSQTHSDPDEAQVLVSPAPSPGLTLPLIIISCLACALFGSTIYLFRWRRSVDGGQQSIVPEVLLEKIAKQTNEYAALRSLLEQYAQLVNATYESTHEKVSDIRQSYQIFQGSLAEKDNEISTLKKGYEANVFNKFILRFIDIHANIAVELKQLEEESEAKDILQDMLELLEDALEECGVEPFSPPLGNDFTETFGVSERCVVIETEYLEKHQQIANVLAPGYLLNTPGGKECLRPSRVEVFKIKEG